MLRNVGRLEKIHTSRYDSRRYYLEPHCFKMRPPRRLRSRPKDSRALHVVDLEMLRILNC